MALVMHFCEKPLHHYHIRRPKCVNKSRKMEGDYHGQRQTSWFLGKEGVTPSDIQRPLSAVRGQKAPPCGSVFSWVRGFSSGKETAQVAVRGWYRSTPVEWL
jgi:hypothetical protein